MCLAGSVILPRGSNTIFLTQCAWPPEQPAPQRVSLGGECTSPGLGGSAASRESQRAQSPARGPCVPTCEDGGPLSQKLFHLRPQPHHREMGCSQRSCKEGFSMEQHFWGPELCQDAGSAIALTRIFFFLKLSACFSFLKGISHVTVASF